MRGLVGKYGASRSPGAAAAVPTAAGLKRLTQSISERTSPFVNAEESTSLYMKKNFDK